MTAEERVRAIVEFGFTERQARFLVTVMLFGGLCVPRQYARFAGTAYGQKVNAFFAKLVQCGYATACGCIHHRARLRAALSPAASAALSGHWRSSEPLSKAGACRPCDRAPDVARRRAQLSRAPVARHRAREG